MSRRIRMVRIPRMSRQPGEVLGRLLSRESEGRIMNFFRGLINALLFELAAVALIGVVVWIVRWVG